MNIFIKVIYLNKISYKQLLITSWVKPFPNHCCTLQSVPLLDVTWGSPHSHVYDYLSFFSALLRSATAAVAVSVNAADDFTACCCVLQTNFYKLCIVCVNTTSWIEITDLNVNQRYFVDVPVEKGNKDHNPFCLFFFFLPFCLLSQLFGFHRPTKLAKSENQHNLINLIASSEFCRQLWLLLLPTLWFLTHCHLLNFRRRHCFSVSFIFLFHFLSFFITVYLYHPVQPAHSDVNFFFFCPHVGWTLIVSNPLPHRPPPLEGGIHLTFLFVGCDRVLVYLQTFRHRWHWWRWRWHYFSIAAFFSQFAPCRMPHTPVPPPLVPVALFFR